MGEKHGTANTIVYKLLTVNMMVENFSIAGRRKMFGSITNTGKIKENKGLDQQPPTLVPYLGPV